MLDKEFGDQPKGQARASTRFLSTATATVLLAMSLQMVLAASPADIEACQFKSDAAACTRVVNDRSQPADVRISAYRMRAIKHREKGDFKSAIDDYTAMIKLDPKDGEGLGSGCGQRPLPEGRMAWSLRARLRPSWSKIFACAL